MNRQVGGRNSIRGGRPTGTRDQKPRQPKMGGGPAGAKAGMANPQGQQTFNNSYKKIGNMNRGPGNAGFVGGAMRGERAKARFGDATKRTGREKLGGGVAGVVNKGQNPRMTAMRDKYATKSQGKNDAQRKAIKQRMLGRMQKRGIISGEKGSGRGVFDKARQGADRGRQVTQAGGAKQGNGAYGGTGTAGGPRGIQKKPQQPLGFGGV